MRMAVMIQLTSYSKCLQKLKCVSLTSPDPLHGGTIFGMEPTDMTGKRPAFLEIALILMYFGF